MIEIVGELTAEELREAALNRLEECLTPMLGPNEFTSRDVAERFGWNQSNISRKLAEQERAGAIESGWRYDPRTGRRARGYWFVNP